MDEVDVLREDDDISCACGEVDLAVAGIAEAEIAKR
jgi:hypothetical protein